MKDPISVAQQLRIFEARQRQILILQGQLNHRVQTNADVEVGGEQFIRFKPLVFNLFLVPQEVEVVVEHSVSWQSDRSAQLKVIIKLVCVAKNGGERHTDIA